MNKKYYLSYVLLFITIVFLIALGDFNGNSSSFATGYDIYDTNARSEQLITKKITNQRSEKTDQIGFIVCQQTGCYDSDNNNPFPMNSFLCVDRCLCRRSILWINRNKTSGENAYAIATPVCPPAISRMLYVFVTNISDVSHAH